jgi:hypothetical protein
MMGQRYGMSQTDISSVNLMYKPYPPQGFSSSGTPDGYALTTWTPPNGATGYTVSIIQRYEYYDHWTGNSSSTEYGMGSSTTGDPSYLDWNGYTGTNTCVISDNMYETYQYTYWYEIQAHFPDGVSSHLVRWYAPIAPSSC